VNSGDSIKPAGVSPSAQHSNNKTDNNSNINMIRKLQRVFHPACRVSFGKHLHKDFDVMNKAFADFEKQAFKNFNSVVQTRSFKPQVDVKEHANRLEIIAELPGMNKDNVEIEVSDGNVLTFRGEAVKNETSEQDTTYHYSERTIGKFERSFQLPEEFKIDQVQAKMNNGLLTLSIPRQEPPQSTKRKIIISDDATTTTSTATN
jgi:HSP20 family protein